tara:strand:+ start:139 stop:327 length:189 start_codon:yes stop_codon:yes gene_type:complete
VLIVAEDVVVVKDAPMPYSVEMNYKTQIFGCINAFQQTMNQEQDGDIREIVLVMDGSGQVKL